MEIKEAIQGRRSVREYTSEPVQEATILELIGAAIMAPSAMNEQPWAFTVVRDQALLAKLSDGAKAHVIATAQTDGSAHPAHGLLDDVDFQIFYHAPVLVVFSGVTQSPWVVHDCTLASENFMLAAHAAGLGTCWIGLAQSYCNTAEGKSALGLSGTWTAVAPIILGRPKVTPPPTSRKAPQVHWVT